MCQMATKRRVNKHGTAQVRVVICTNHVANTPRLKCGYESHACSMGLGTDNIYIPSP